MIIEATLKNGRNNAPVIEQMKQVGDTTIARLSDGSIECLASVSRAQRKLMLREVPAVPNLSAPPPLASSSDQVPPQYSPVIKFCRNLYLATVRLASGLRRSVDRLRHVIEAKPQPFEQRRKGGTNAGAAGE